MNEIAYEIDIQGTITDLIFKIPVPMSESEKQYILNNKINIKPTKTYFDGATMFAEFNFPELNTQKLTIAHEGTTNVRTYDLKTAKLINKNLNSNENLNKYLIEEENIEINDPIVKSYASKITGETREEIVQNIYEFAQKHMTYKHIQGVSGAKRALRERVGECSEYSAIMIALCRAKGIPARLVIGHIAREQNTKHNWVEVYFDEYGWVTFDPTARPVMVNIYKNGKLVKQEKRFDTNKIPVKYIGLGEGINDLQVFNKEEFVESLFSKK
jgi:transglutaminase-like putative cysteine protease